MDKNCDYLMSIGLDAVWPAYLCMPLRREWTDALWRAHYALGNWALLAAEELQP